MILKSSSGYKKMISVLANITSLKCCGQLLCIVYNLQCIIYTCIQVVQCIIRNIFMLRFLTLRGNSYRKLKIKHINQITFIIVFTRSLSMKSFHIKTHFNTESKSLKHADINLSNEKIVKHMWTPELCV